MYIHRFSVLVLLIYIYHLGCYGALLERVELEFVVSLAQSWHINVVQPIQQHRAIQLLWLCHLSDHLEPSWASVSVVTQASVLTHACAPLGPLQPVLNGQQLGVVCLAGYLLLDTPRLLGRLCCAKQVIQQPTSIRQREENRAL